jgi:ribonuclease P protein component
VKPWGDPALTGEQAIRQLFHEGVVHHGRYLLLIERRVTEEPRRVLFVASRRVGNAVVRNRAKRVMRVAYQELAGSLESLPVHIAWIARSSIAAATKTDVRMDMESLLIRAALLQRDRLQRPAENSPQGTSRAS